jgi:hypothetical protein
VRIGFTLTAPEFAFVRGDPRVKAHPLDSHVATPFLVANSAARLEVGA